MRVEVGQRLLLARRGLVELDRSGAPVPSHRLTDLRSSTRVAHLVSSTQAHPYREPWPQPLPPEVVLERAPSEWRRGWFVVSLAAHVGVVLLTMRCSRLERIEAAPNLHPPNSTRVELRQLARIEPRREPYLRVICGGFPPPEPPDDHRSEYVPPEPPEPAAPPSAPATLVVAPSVLHALLVSGKTRIEPSAQVRTSMLRDGVTRIDTVIKVCIGADGAVSSATLLRSTRYADHDAAVLSEIRSWRYRPFLRDGVARPACSAVTIHL